MNIDHSENIFQHENTKLSHLKTKQFIRIFPLPDFTVAMLDPLPSLVQPTFQDKI